jgi:L-alanine-DL-glutamate epimerase-like enolase superfamily enzyme
MKIESVDFFYVTMPEVLDIGDGSQDALLVRLQAGNYTGWGECEASPLVSIASWVAPMSHSACKPLRDSVLGQSLNDIEDIKRIGDLVRANGLDLLQTDHTLSGIDIAMWDLLGKKLEQPVYKLLGYHKAFGKTAYASQLFGDAPEITYHSAREAVKQGYRAVKFGWGPFGKSTAKKDQEQLVAAREGLGKEASLLVDAGTIWIDDVTLASSRIKILEEVDALWLEEPFISGALQSYATLAKSLTSLKLAAGEGSHNYYMAQHLIDHANVGFIQIDAGRIGGITVAKQVADYAVAKNIQFVNHTFTSNLALSASLQPLAGLEKHHLCEFPISLKALAAELTEEKIAPNEQGVLELPERPGLGVTPNISTIQKYFVDVEIKVNDRIIYKSPRFSS